MWTPNFYFRLFFLALMWLCMYANFNKVMSIEHLQQFDPYEILGLDTSATMPEIRRKYRRESLNKHPDKNPDDPLAV
mgnify:CR=1 FL=1